MIVTGNRKWKLFSQSTKRQKISQLIDVSLNRGLTYLQAEGGYQHDQKQVIYLVVQPREIPQLKQLIKAIDERAFVTVLDAHEVIGEGFSYQRKRYHVNWQHSKE